MDKEELHIIQKLREGDNATFHRVYQQYYPKLLGIAKKYPSYWLDPEDFIQETFVRLNKYKEKLKDNVSLDAQLKVICKTTIYRFHQRDQKFVKDYEIKENIKEEKEEELDEFLAERINLMMDYIEELPPQQKDMLLMHKINNYSYEDIEEMTGLSKKTIANHIYLAKKKLYDQLRKPEE